MKQTIYVLVLAAVMSACSSIWGRTDLPEAVKVRFSELYPSAKEVEWENTAENYEAEFEVGGRDRTAVFTAAGKLISYAEEIEEQNLPGSALQELGTRYASFSIDEVHRVQQQGSTYYRVELDRKEEELLLHFDSTGHLLKQENTAPQRTGPESASLLDLDGFLKKDKELLGAPVAQWELPAELREVSGIAFLEKDLLACVQDEEGTIFLYDLGQQAVVRKISFAGPGDYEGLVIVAETAYVLRSDGAVYEVSAFMSNKPQVRLHKSVLAATQNTEGLAYDATNHRLLIACKGYDSSLGESKGIYALSLADKKMQPAPVITIPLAQEPLQSTGKMKKPYDALQPSSLEIDPASGKLYMLDAVHHRLYIVSQQGQIQRSVSLDKKQLRQPEALTFGDDGEIYIASEGKKKGRAVIIKYSPNA